MSQEKIKYPKLELHKEIEYFKMLPNPEIKERLICSFLFLVDRIVKKYKKYSHYEDDLTQEGILGLIRAVEKYEIDKGISFKLYASWWIVLYIKRTLNKQVTFIQTPKYVTDIAEYIIRHKIDYKSNNLIKLAKSLNIKISFLEKAIYYLENPMIINYDYTEIETTDNFAIKHEKKEVKQKIISKLYYLDAKEKIVVKMFFGINPYRKHTLQEIGEIFQRSNVRIHQIKNEAIKKLKKEIKDDFI